MIFLWVLTWYSYWIFMKNQITAINVIGATISAGLLIFSHFSYVRDAVSKSLKLVRSKISKKSQLMCTSPSSLIKELPETSITQIQLPKDEKISQQKTEIKTQKQETESIKQLEPTEQITVPKTQKQKPKAPQQITEIKTQKQETECIKLADNPQQLPSKANGCPKNLDYYTKKPRPKQTPEECITCKNLINCVCLTSN